MSVELEPAELGFKRPFTHEVSQILRLRNPNSEPLAFKVKTTAPKQYCVRPNSGRIEPGRNVEVQVLLQAMKEDPPPDARCKDKFLVQSVAISADKDSSNVSQLWQSIEQNAKSSIQEKKIRVSFLPAGASTNGLGGAADAPPAYSSTAINPQRNSAADDSMIGDRSFGDAVDTAPAPAHQPSTLGAAAAAITSAIPMSQDDLKRQLDAANGKIQQLQQQASEGLRQRKTAEGGEKSGGGAAAGTGMQNAPAPGGVPIQIVALLCLVCFLIAYLFF